MVVSAAQAAEQPYCALWARERTRIELMSSEDIDTRTLTEAGIVKMAETFFNTCLLAETNHLAMPRVSATRTVSWAANMRELIVNRSGVAPATDNYEAQCAAEYRTWDPETKTVVRKGSPERVPCPCGKEVDCED